MPDLNWNDLRHVLAVARAGTLAAAARRLGVDETTVARRLAAVEAALGARLFARVGTGGTLRPTQAGETATMHAERTERELDALREAVAGVDAAAAGTVRLTSVPIVVNRVLLPALRDLYARHPLLRLELIAEPRDMSLTKREADIALRLARPRAGGSGVLARRIGRLDYAVFVPASCHPSEEAGLPWITYEEGMAELPQARWVAAMTARGEAGAPTAPLRVNDAEALLHAVRAGLGRSILPCAVGDREPGLRRFGSPEPVLSRDLWLLTHADLRPLARIAAVIEWLERTIRRLDTEPA